MEHVLASLEQEFSEAGKVDHFASLKLFLTGQNAETTYADVAAQLSMSEQAARAAVSRLRRRFRLLLKKEIAQTVSSPQDVEDEVRWLFRALQY